MDSGAHQQAYDRGSTIFSPDGRLYQVEYAREAVDRGAPSVGVVADDCTVLAARKRVRSPLLEPTSVEKVHAVDDHLAIASAGHAADARQLVDVARRASQRHRLRYDEQIGVETLAKRLADHVQERTQNGGSRPYGAALLVGGADPAGEATRPRLFEVDPSGTPYGWNATAVGDGANDVRGFFEAEFEDGGSGGGRQWAIETALEGLDATTGDDLEPERVEVRTIDSRDGVEALSSARIGDALAEVGS
ncbi:proteasome subunit alpha [Halobiforma lacisalsi AJ5]|uniref:Proteasome subunit alpha n=1 Tax=Natronobacterium lacisalsi AJ5 TaxID=358396 RepID=M0LHU0_NATLA|nr:archaeal proteasome endopeptidase complex subunit alpha [Halobiforma lacisalsi]APW98562.1 proteasome subunit alpha [Halobiforma lacisalsi AJ5]EMA33091.1 proteasome subunit alpha [Halobiforma lacisalsi AJ5]